MKKLESFNNNKFKLSKNELKFLGGTWFKYSYEERDTAPEDGGGCDRVVVDRCWVISSATTGE
ncbi:MAG: hypothetical protein WD512_05005 [Candidatus Paceibacterota bacterium]